MCVCGVCVCGVCLCVGYVWCECVMFVCDVHGVCGVCLWCVFVVCVCGVCGVWVWSVCKTTLARSSVIGCAFKSCTTISQRRV